MATTANAEVSGSKALLLNLSSLLIKSEHLLEICAPQGLLCTPMWEMENSSPLKTNKYMNLLVSVPSELLNN